MWAGPSGERPLLPKDEGSGLMISSLICREHGLIRELDINLLTQVNHSRLHSKYADEEAAIEVYGSALKKDLKKSPFLVYFEYGESKEGYWNYAHMVCQFEDCVDVLKILLQPTYHFVFLFDQSSGHSKQRPDGLNATRMNKSFGGRNTLMRETKIETVQGYYLGTYNSILHPGDTQCLTFLQSDQGPFWLTPTQAELCRHDVVIGTKNADRNRLSLTMDLLSKEVNTKGKSKR